LDDNSKHKLLVNEYSWPLFGIAEYLLPTEIKIYGVAYVGAEKY